MVDWVASHRVLLLVTFQPEFEPPWIGRPYVTLVAVNRLGERDIAAIIDGVTGNKFIPSNIRQDIIERTDGIPLFVEEMTKAVLEAESEGDARQTAAAVPSPLVAVPASLHASLLARLDRLGPAKELAQIGAVIGREFSHALLAAVLRKPDDELQPLIERLMAFSFVDEFVEAVQEVFPKCCIHFEDWTGTDAVHLLQRYRDKYCVYNDDVQGTAGITLAGMINAAKLKGTKLKDEKYLFLGAGSAAIGLADLLCSALVAQGMTLKDAQSRVYMFDINGLLESTRKDLVDFQKPYAHRHASTKNFVAALESIKPTTIIGVSTIGGAFTQKVVESMSRLNERPVILALSNPTEHAECTAEQAYTWSNGKAIYAAGVQFAPVHYNGQTFLPGQANNFYIFPAVGMAIFATQAKRVTDEMFIEAGQAVADQVAPALLKQGLLYPLQANILETEIQTAARVAKLVFDSGLARVERPTDMVSFIRRQVYEPEYCALATAATKAA